MYDFNEEELDKLQKLRYDRSVQVVLDALERGLSNKMTVLVEAGSYDKEALILTGEYRLLKFLKGD